jgi:hypothetical protein
VTVAETAGPMCFDRHLHLGSPPDGKVLAESREPLVSTAHDELGGRAVQIGCEGREQGFGAAVADLVCDLTYLGPVAAVVVCADEGGWFTRTRHRDGFDPVLRVGLGDGRE